MEEQKETTVPVEDGAKSGKMKKCKERMAKCKERILQHKKKIISVMGVLLLVVAVGVGGYFYQKDQEQKNANSVKASAEKFIKENMLAPGTDFEIREFKEEGGVYKMSLTVQKQEIDAYVTKDGKKLFPQAIELEKKEDIEKAPTGPAPVTEVSQKTDVPVVELFVMSYCPYGTQMEKGILPVVKTLGSKIKFDIKFVSYVMHAEKEFKENINQYCIQKEEPSKFLGYLECFNKESDSAKCATRSKINNAKIATCVSAVDKQFNLTEMFKAPVQGGAYPPFNIHKELNEKYGVQGSPSLVINGQLIESGRDSASILKAVCSGFTNAPKECSATLSSETPTPGFGEGTVPATAGGTVAPAASCE